MSVRLRLEIVSEKKPDTHAEELALIRLRHEVCVHLLRWKMNQLERISVDKFLDVEIANLKMTGSGYYSGSALR